MAISDELFLAILAMDAYNRGYNPGIQVAGTQIGNASLGATSAALGTGVAEAASFFAQAYTWNGQRVISYRGTDVISADMMTGWGTGAGIYATPQAQMAAEFYKTVIRNPDNGGLTAPELYSAQVILTGHSLGGGLAGFIASLYGKQARIFDNMPFELASSGAYDAARAYPHFDQLSGDYLGTYPDDAAAREPRGRSGGDRLRRGRLDRRRRGQGYGRLL